MIPSYTQGSARPCIISCIFFPLKENASEEATVDGKSTAAADNPIEN
jgi:hypothetical protein